MQECLKESTDPGIHPIATPQQTQTPSVCFGKLVDNPSIMPVFTIENVVDYLIYRKEEDNMRAEDWKSFKTGGFKLFNYLHLCLLFLCSQATFPVNFDLEAVNDEKIVLAL